MQFISIEMRDSLNPLCILTRKERFAMWRPQGVRGRPYANTKEPGRASEEVQTKRVLVVGTEPGICALLARLLAGTGYAVDVASSGYHAWEMMWQKRYAAIVLDLRTPGSSGEVLYQRLREVDERLTRRMIFVTGNTADHTRIDFVIATGTPLIEKPLNLAELQRQLQSLFDKEEALP